MSSGSNFQRQGERYLGQTLGGRFLLQRVLGAGGMGLVFAALDLTSARQVALKLTLTSGTPAQVARFLREGEISAQLDHPGIVRIHTAGEVQGQPYLVYELVPEARELGEVFRSADLPARLELVAQVAEALGYAHGLGIVHRDVKPENVLVDADGRARLSDFGIAAIEGAQRLTATGAWIGTPLYMAPERFSTGASSPTPATDVWSLGVLLYEALTGHAPFHGLNLQELAPQIARATPAPPRELVPTISKDLQRVCLKALSRDPVERYASGRDLARDLRRVQRGEALEGRARRAPLPLLALSGVGLTLLLGGALSYAFGPTPQLLPSATLTRPQATLTPSPSASSSSPQLPPLGWHLARGQRFTGLIEWWDVWDDLSGAREGTSVNYRVELRIQFEVREVRGRLATLDATLERVLMSLDDMRLDSRKPSALVPVDRIVDKGFTLRLELPSGRVQQVLGVEHLRDEIVAAALPPARPLLTTLLGAFNDDVLKSHLGIAFHQRDDPAPGARFELQRELRLTRVFGVRVASLGEREGDQARWTSSRCEGLDLPSGDRLENPSVSGTTAFASGRALTSSLTCAVVHHSSEARRKLLFELRYRELPGGKEDGERAR